MSFNIKCEEKKKISEELQGYYCETIIIMAWPVPDDEKINILIVCDNFLQQNLYLLRKVSKIHGKKGLTQKSM